MSIISGWQIEDPLCYFLCCLALTLALRVVHCVFKTLGTKDGEHSPKGGCQEQQEKQEDPKIWKWRVIYWRHLKGFGCPQLNDHWLPAIVGFFELAAYPVLLATGNIIGILGWLAVKSVPGWKVWAESRTPYNRFLLGNVLSLVFAYGLLLAFVESVPPPSP